MTRYNLEICYDQVSVNVYNFGTNSEKNITNKKSIIINGSMVLGGVKPIGIINFGKIFTIILENFFKNGSI